MILKTEDFKLYGSANDPEKKVRNGMEGGMVWIGN